MPRRMAEGYVAWSVEDKRLVGMASSSDVFLDSPVWLAITRVKEECTYVRRT